MKPYAAQLYTVRDLLKTEEEVRRTLPRVRKAGYEYVQVSAVGGASGKTLRSILDDSGLKAIANHAEFGDLKDQRQSVFEEMNNLGCRHSALGALPGEYQNKEGWPKGGEILGEIAEDFHRNGLTFSYHCHAGEFERYLGRTGYELMFARAGKYLGVEFDVFWLANAGCDPPYYLANHHGPMPLMHLKDCAVVNGRPMTGEVGYGNLNWDAIFRAARGKVEWYIVEQDNSIRDPVDSLAMSLRFLKNRQIALGI